MGRLLALCGRTQRLSGESILDRFSQQSHVAFLHEEVSPLFLFTEGSWKSCDSEKRCRPRSYGSIEKSSLGPILYLEDNSDLLFVPCSTIFVCPGNVQECGDVIESLDLRKFETVPDKNNNFDESLNYYVELVISATNDKQ